MSAIFALTTFILNYVPEAKNTLKGFSPSLCERGGGEDLLEVQNWVLKVQGLGLMKMLGVQNSTPLDFGVQFSEFSSPNQMFASG